MVCFCDSTSLCNSLNMGNHWNLTDQTLNSKQNHQIQRHRKIPNPPKPFQSINLPFCEQSRTGPIDVIYLIAVISAFGYLIFPYIKLCFNGITRIVAATFSVVEDEVYRAPLVYVSIGLSLFFAIVAALLVFKCMNNNCGKPNCRGLSAAPEFDIQIEADDSGKNSTSSFVIEGAGKGDLKLSQDHHRELEAELKKLAPPNGRAVLLFRARCGCPVGRMEVPGLKKPRKVKK